MKFWVKTALCIGCLGLSQWGDAAVSLRNGNVFLGFRDVEYLGGYNFAMDRVYNSKTVFNGMFGHGWGNDLDVNLEIAADGSVTVHEYGGGASNRFDSTAVQGGELDKVVDEVVNAARAAGYILNVNQLGDYKNKVRNNVEFRNKEWSKLVQAGRVQKRVLPKGTKLTSNRYSIQALTVTENGYIRTTEGGKIEYFDKQGKLIKLQDPAGHFVEIFRTKSGLIDYLKDSLNRKIYFTYTKSGKVGNLKGENNKTAEYRYNDKDELIFARGFDNESFQYSYSTDSRHFLTLVGYQDKTTMQMAYYGADQLDNVKSVKDREGIFTEYSYSKVPNEALKNLRVTVAVKAPGAQSSIKSVYDYVFKNKAWGEEWIYKLTSDMEGFKTSNTYDEATGLPAVIVRNNEMTQFKYDPKGRLTRKEEPNAITELQYDPKVGKINFVKIASKTAGASAQQYSYQYDAKGNLSFAKNNAQGAKFLSAKLFYDNLNRVKTLVYSNNRKVDVEYSASSQPIQVVDTQGPTLKMQYNQSGELVKVDRVPSANQRVPASTAGSPFDDLMDLVKPAGVKLSI